MQATLGELAALVEGRLFGDENILIQGAASLRDAEPGHISLIDGDGKNHLLQQCRAAAVIAPKNFSSQDFPAILVDDVHRAFAIVVLHFHPQRRPGGSASAPWP